jgi:hypothetical protein
MIPFLIPKQHRRAAVGKEVWRVRISEVNSPIKLDGLSYQKLNARFEESDFALMSNWSGRSRSTVCFGITGNAFPPRPTFFHD